MNERNQAAEWIWYLALSAQWPSLKRKCVVGCCCSVWPRVPPSNCFWGGEGQVSSLSRESSLAPYRVFHGFASASLSLIFPQSFCWMLFLSFLRWNPSLLIETHKLVPLTWTGKQIKSRRERLLKNYLAVGLEVRVATVASFSECWRHEYGEEAVLRF